MLRSTGITRKMDEFGRVVIPRELRTKLDMEEGDDIEILVDGATIVLKKYDPTCMFCGMSDNLFIYNDRLICENCKKEISKLKILKKHCN